MTNGKFITLEGGEGAGKSTQAVRLTQRLHAAGIAALVTEEPGGTPFGKRIRELVLSNKPEVIETELFLFAAQRVEHLAVTIGPALQRGSWVISDRFIDSTRVYQGDLGGLDQELIRQVERLSVTRMPDLTMVLDVPVELGHTRAKARGATNRFDEQSLAKHEIIRQGFLRIAQAERERCAVVDGSADEEAVAEAIWRVVAERLHP